MNAHNWARSRLLLAEHAARCAVAHDWLDPDPVTGRRHCRRCLAFTPGFPDSRRSPSRHGYVSAALGWTAEKAETYGGEPNPEFAGVKANLVAQGRIRA